MIDWEAASAEKPPLPPHSGMDHGTTTRRSAAARILVVEDDYFIAMEIESALRDAGYEVVGIAATATEAEAMAHDMCPDMAVMDIRLAGRRDGVDAAGDPYREIGVRCVFATAHDDPQTRARAAPFSPLGWLSKPYTMTSLINQVREAVAKSSSR